MSLTKEEEFFLNYTTKNNKIYLTDHKSAPATWGNKSVAQCCGAHQVDKFISEPMFNGLLMELSNNSHPELIEDKLGRHSPGSMETYMQHVSIPIEEKDLGFKFINLRLLRKQIT